MSDSFLPFPFTVEQASGKTQPVNNQDIIRAISVSAVFLLILTVLTVLIAHESEKKLDASQNALKRHTSHHITHIEHRLLAIQNTLQTFKATALSNDGTLRLGQELKQPGILDFSPQQDAIQHIALLDTTGTILQQTGPMQTALSPQEWASFTAARKSIRTGRAYITPATPKDAYGTPVFAIMLPIYQQNGAFAGAILADIDANHLSRPFQVQHSHTPELAFAFIRADGKLLHQSAHMLPPLSAGLIARILATTNGPTHQIEPRASQHDWPDVTPKGPYQVAVGYSQTFPFALIYLENIKQEIIGLHIKYTLLALLFIIISGHTAFQVYRLSALKNLEKRWQKINDIHTKVALTLSDDFPQPVIFLTAAGTILQHNTATQPFLKTIHAQDVSLTQAWLPANAPCIFEALQEVKRKGRQQDVVFNHQIDTYKATLIPIGHSGSGAYIILMYITAQNTEQGQLHETLPHHTILPPQNLEYDSQATVISKCIEASIENTLRALIQIQISNPNTEPETHLEKAIHLTRKSLLDITHIREIFASDQNEHKKTEENIRMLCEERIMDFYQKSATAGLDIEVYIESSVPEILLLNRNHFQRLLYSALQYCMDNTEQDHIGLWFFCDTSFPCTLKLEIVLKEAKNFPAHMGSLITRSVSKDFFQNTLRDYGLPLTTLVHSIQELDGQLTPGSPVFNTTALAIEFPISPTSPTHPLVHSSDLATAHVILLCQNPVRTLKVSTYLTACGAQISCCDTITTALEMLDHFSTQPSMLEHLALITDAALMPTLAAHRQQVLSDIFCEALPAEPTQIGSLINKLLSHFQYKRRKPAPLSDTYGKTNPDTEPNQHLGTVPKRILIAMDTPLNKKQLTAILTSIGYDVAAVNDGHALLTDARSGRFDAVMIASQVGHISGVELTHAIRSLPQPACAIPIFITTNHSSSSYQEIAHSSGCSGVILRPFATHTLEHLLDRHLNPRPMTHVLLQEDELIRSERDFGPAAMKNLVVNFLNDSDIRLERIRTALNLGDFETVMEQSLQLLNTSDTLAAPALKNTCQHLVTSCTNKQIHMIKSSVTELSHIQQETCLMLRNRYQLPQPTHNISTTEKI